MKKQKEKRKMYAVLVLTVIALGIFLTFWAGLFFASKPRAFMSHYLANQGRDSRIYVASQTSSYGYAEKTYISSDRHEIVEGSGVFTIALTLRNDYSSDNPPPTSGIPISPIDGTAYIRLKATLFNNDAKIPTINISQSDFVTIADQVGIVLSSGQTVNKQLLLATNQTRITGYIVTLEFVGDSIPR